MEPFKDPCGNWWKSEPLILLHGFDSSFLEFRRIYPLLKQNFQVIIPDLLGFGFSPRYATNEYTSSKIVLHLLDIIDNLNITEKLKLVGASMGGSTAIKLSVEIPKLIDKLILLSPAGLFGEPKIFLFLLIKLGLHF